MGVSFHFPINKYPICVDVDRVNQGTCEIEGGEIYQCNQFRRITGILNKCCVFKTE